MTVKRNELAVIRSNQWESSQRKGGNGDQRRRETYWRFMIGGSNDSGECGDSKSRSWNHGVETREENRRGKKSESAHFCWRAAAKTPPKVHDPYLFNLVPPSQPGEDSEVPNGAVRNRVTAPVSLVLPLRAKRRLKPLRVGVSET